MITDFEPQPVSPFYSAQEVIEDLITYHQTQSILQPAVRGNVKDIVEASAWDNIHKDFRRSDAKISKAFHGWAKSNYADLRNALQKIGNQAEYDEAILQFTHRFIDDWAEKCDHPSKRIGFGPAVKMINLLVKTMQRHKTERINGLEAYMHVPLDWFTLAPMCFIVNDLVDVKYALPITENSTAEFVVNVDLYLLLQSAMRKLANQANCPPIVYDYMCWDGQH